MVGILFDSQVASCYGSSELGKVKAKISLQSINHNAMSIQAMLKRSAPQNASQLPP